MSQKWSKKSKRKNCTGDNHSPTTYGCVQWSPRQLQSSQLFKFIAAIAHRKDEVNPIRFELSSLFGFSAVLGVLVCDCRLTARRHEKVNNWCQIGSTNALLIDFILCLVFIVELLSVQLILLPCHSTLFHLSNKREQKILWIWFGFIAVFCRHWPLRPIQACFRFSFKKKKSNKFSSVAFSFLLSEIL